jgi:hypothetical protein
MTLRESYGKSRTKKRGARKWKVLIGFSGLLVIISSISSPHLLLVRDAVTGKALSGAYVFERCDEMIPSAAGGSQNEKFSAIHRTGILGYCITPPRVVFHFPLLTWLDHEFGVYAPGYFAELQTRSFSVRLQPMEMYLDYCPYRTPRGYVLPMYSENAYFGFLNKDSPNFSGDIRRNISLLAQRVQFLNITARGIYLTFPGCRLTKISTVRFESNFKVFDAAGNRWDNLVCQNFVDGHEVRSFLYKIKMGNPEPSVSHAGLQATAPFEFRMITYTKEIFRVCKSGHGWSVYRESENPKTGSRLLGEIRTDRPLLAACIGTGIDADLYLAFRGLGVRRFVLPGSPGLGTEYIFKEDPMFAFNIQNVLDRDVVAIAVGNSPSFQNVLYVVCGDDRLFRFSLEGIPDGKVAGIRFVEAVDKKTWGNDRWRGLVRGGGIEPLKTRNAGSGQEVVPEYDPDVARKKELTRFVGQPRVVKTLPRRHYGKQEEAH